MVRVRGSVSAAVAGRTPALRSLTRVLSKERALVALVLGALVYVFLAWTPANYGEGARLLGVPGAGPVVGHAEPIRSDDWAVTIPYFQLAVANDFGPRNEASPYKEPLKAYFALPSRDWSMAFKPDLWGFLVLNPAHAYSLHYAVLSLAMLVGFAVLLRQLGCAPGYALAVSAILFSSQFVQVWWTSNAPALAWGPWTAVLFLWRGPWWVRWPALAYVSAVWLIGELYPPLIVATALAMAVLIVAFRPDALRPFPILCAGLAVAVGSALAWVHFADLTPVMRATAYPGERTWGGGGVPALQLAAHVFPSFVTARYEPLPSWPTNACEIGVVGSFLPLAVACFCDHGALLAVARSRPRAIAIWFAGLAVLAAWMLLPIPAGAAPLLNLVAPGRMLWGFGLLLLLGLAVAVARVPWGLSAVRIVAFVAAVLAAWVLSKFILFRAPLAFGRFDVVIVPLLAVLLIARRFVPGLGPRRLALLAVALTALVTFGRFNPVQPAGQIFRPQRSEPVDVLRAYARANPKGWAIATRYLGGLAPGAGVPAINHVLLQPQLAFFRQAYPDMPAPAFNATFNRYAHIKPAVRWAPALIQPDLIEVPPDPFAIPLEVQIAAPAAAGTAGAVDRVEVVRLGPTRWGVSVEGWGNWSGVTPGQRLGVTATGPARIVRASGYRLPRPDVVAARKDPAMFASGFGLRLEVEAAAAPRAFRIVTVDPRRGPGSVLP